MMREHRMEIYIADISRYEEKALYQKHLMLLPEERQERIGRYRCKEDRWRGVGAGILLEYGLNRYGFTLRDERREFELVHLAQGRYGKPYILEQQLCYNLSHGGSYVAAVFTDCEAGIDIERIRTAKLPVAKRFFTEEEYQYLLSFEEKEKSQSDTKATPQDVAFARMWTRKESYIKAVGEGMHLPLANFCVLTDQIAGDEVYYLRSWEIPEGYAMSVCARTPISSEVTWVDIAKSV